MPGEAAGHERDRGERELWETKRHPDLLVTLLASASEAEQRHMPPEDTVTEELLAYATGAEMEQAKASLSMHREGLPFA